MTQLVADDYAEIARRLREIEGSGRIEARVRYGIWFAPSDRQPGWCFVDGGKWAVVRDGDGKSPTLFDDVEGAHLVIGSKVGGSWDTGDMQVLEYHA